MTKFRPCIDLHSGQVKQIVGGSLTSNSAQLQTNHVSEQPASYFAALYRQHKLQGAHVIMLGPGNEGAAREALQAWPGAMQVGGGINEGNARQWIEAGASKVIVTSHLFPGGTFSLARLQGLLAALDGDTSKLVIDLSCRRQPAPARGAGAEGSKHEGREEERWVVATNKWQTITDFEINWENMRQLEPYCSEFLIHAADHEGLQAGIDAALVRRLAGCCRLPVTYAGGARALADLEAVRELSGGRVDVTIGSALDIFGGAAVRFADCVAWNRRVEADEQDEQDQR